MQAKLIHECYFGQNCVVFFILCNHNLALNEIYPAIFMPEYSHITQWDYKFETQLYLQLYVVNAQKPYFYRAFLTLLTSNHPSLD